MIITKNLSEQLFNKFTSFVYSNSGIYIKPSKKILLANRIRKRLFALKINSYEDYYEYLLKNYKELEHLINVVSTNESYFFRNRKHIEDIKNIIFPKLLERKENIKIWSAGCASGEEPYTLAILADELGVLKRVKIIASDINTEVLQNAKIGKYSNRKLKELDDNIKIKYFTKINDKEYQLSPRIIKNVHFFHHNLIRDLYPENIDLILCRNVLIYFDRKNQKYVIDNFYKSLNHESYLLIGHAETLFAIPNRFNYLKLDNISLYFK